MQSLLDMQKAFYAPKRGPPMLVHHEPNPLRRRKRKRRKLAARHVLVPQRAKDTLPTNFAASQLPDGFPPDLAFRALAAYSLLRTLSCELRLSPFTPNVFLRALYLPFPSKLIGQVHASLLRFLLLRLNMGYSCKPRGGNIPYVVRKKRRVDGIRWPLRAGDNLTTLDNFCWPLFFDDYVHLRADILWATMNDDENHADFRNIGMPDLTGKTLDEDFAEQDEEQSLLAKPARASTHEKNPCALNALLWSCRSARQSKSPDANVDSEEGSSEDEPFEVVEVDDEYVGGQKANSKKRRRFNTRSIPKSTTAKPRPKEQPAGEPSPFSHSFIEARETDSTGGFKTNGSNQLQKQIKHVQAKSLTYAKNNGKLALLPPASLKSTKESHRMLPSCCPNKSVPMKQEVNKRRSPGAGRKLPIHGKKIISTPIQKANEPHFSGSKVEWVEEGPSPSHFGGLKSSSATSFRSSPATVRNGVHTCGALRRTCVPEAAAPPFTSRHLLNQNSNFLMAQQRNADLSAWSHSAHVQSNADSFYPSGPVVRYDVSTIPNLSLPSYNQISGNVGLRLHSFGKSNSGSALEVSTDVSSALHDFVGGKLTKQTAAPNPSSENTLKADKIKGEIDKPASVASATAEATYQDEIWASDVNVSTITNRRINLTLTANKINGCTEVEPNGLNLDAAQGNRTGGVVPAKHLHAGQVFGAIRHGEHDQSKGLTEVKLEGVNVHAAESLPGEQNRRKTSRALANATDVEEGPRGKHDQSNGLTAVKLERTNVFATYGDQSELPAGRQEIAGHFSYLEGVMNPEEPSSSSRKSMTRSTAAGNDIETGKPKAPTKVSSIGEGGQRCNSTQEQQASSSATDIVLAEASLDGGTSESERLRTPLLVSKPNWIPDRGQGDYQSPIKIGDMAWSKDSGATPTVRSDAVSTKQAMRITGFVRYGQVRSAALTNESMNGSQLGTIGADNYFENLTPKALAASEVVADVLTPLYETVLTRNKNLVVPNSAATSAELIIDNKDKTIAAASGTEAVLCENPLAHGFPAKLKDHLKNAPKAIQQVQMTLPGTREQQSEDIVSADKQRSTLNGPFDRVERAGLRSALSSVVVVSTSDDTDEQSITSGESDASLPFADDEEQWPQFQPIRSMRAGMPYHRLPLEEKLMVLEFLIDELLSTDSFSSVFTQRSVGSIHGSNYGALPSKAEFAELENEDECAVCKGEGELLCCDGCISSYHRSCMDMKQNEVLPEGRWLCPECDLVDPAKFGTLKGGKKSALDWFTVADIHTAIRLKNAKEQSALASIDGTTSSNNLCSQQTHGLANPSTSTKGSSCFCQQSTGTAVGGNCSWNHSVRSNQSAIPSLTGLKGNNLAILGKQSSSTKNAHGVLGPNSGSASAARAIVAGPQLKASNSSGLHLSGGTSVEKTSLKVPWSGKTEETTGQVIFSQGRRQLSEEFLVIHGFVFARFRGSSQKTRPSKDGGDPSSSLVPLSINKLLQVLKSIGPETSIAWPLTQIPFVNFEESGGPKLRGIEHPKVLAFNTKATYDPSSYANKYRKTPLSKNTLPGANFQSILLLLSDYEYVCSGCNSKRLSDRLSPDTSNDRILAQSLRAEANLFNPYQLMRDYMLKLENLLNRAHLLNEFWGTRNKEVKAHVWQINVRNCRSIPRLAALLLKLVDACHRRAFVEQWFAICGSKDDHPMEEAPLTEFRALNPLPTDWTLTAEKQKRKWERSSLANVLALLAQEDQDVETWVYGEEKGPDNRRKRKQAVTGRLPYSPCRIIVPLKDSKKFVVGDESSTNKAAFSKRDIAGLLDKEKKKKIDTEAPGLVSVQQAIGRRVTTGIPSNLEKDELEGVQDEIARNSRAGTTPKSRRSRRSGRLQTKESSEDCIANVIAESGKSQNDLSMATLIEAQKMSKLMEIKELCSIPFAGAGHWPVAGRLLFDPIGSLCRSETRRLGRNVGTVMAQNVSYTGSYEVGLVSHFHAWRKSMMECYSYEQLVLLIRALESNLDKPTITSCEALARRTPHARAQVSMAVCCVQKDALTGIDHHFIRQKNKNRGSWVSSQTLELSPFMVERSERREKQQEGFSKKLREKSIEEARAREAARLRAAAEAASRNQAMMGVQAEARAKAAKEQAEAKANALRKKAEAKAAIKAAKAKKKSKEKAEKGAAKAKLKAEREAVREASRQATKAKAFHAPSAHSTPQQSPSVVVIQNEVKRVLSSHRLATQQLIRQSSNAGLSFVPEADIKKLRMIAVANLQKCYHGIKIKNDTMFSQLGKAESAALQVESEAKKEALEKRVQHISGEAQAATNREALQGWPPPSQSMPGSSQEARGTVEFPSQRPPLPAPMYPAQGSRQSLAHTTSGGSTNNMQLILVGQEVGNRNLTNLQAGHIQLHTNPSSSLAPSPMQVLRSPVHVGVPYKTTPSSQHPNHTNACTPNSTNGLSQSQSQCAEQTQAGACPRASSGTSDAVVGHARGAYPRTPQNQQIATGGMDWGTNTQLFPNHLLQQLRGDPSTQQSLQGMNYRMRGHGDAWNLSRYARENQGKEATSTRQMSNLAWLASASPNMQNLLQYRSTGGLPPHEHASLSSMSVPVPLQEQSSSSSIILPDSTDQYQGLPRANEYRLGLAISNRLHTQMTNFHSGQFLQHATPGGGTAYYGYHNPNIYEAPAGYRQEIPVRHEGRSGVEPQLVCDFEPTPISERAPTLTPPLARQPNHAYIPSGYPHQQYPPQHQWFQ